MLTIGAYGAPSEPTVSVSGVTITGGLARSSPESTQSAFFGVAGQWAAGGGIEIPPNASLTGGATVTVSNSVITGNHADPTTPIPSGIPCPGFSDGQCPFAVALGGGIDSWGTLTLVNTTVSDNGVGAAGGLPPVASDADGAGIYSDEGSLALIHSGAGIFNNSLLELIGDTVSNNSGTASGPAGTAAGGGIWNGVNLSGPPVQLTLTRTAVTRNALSAGPGITVQGGGLFTTLPVTLMGSLIAGNIPDQCSGCSGSAAVAAGPQARENNQAGRRPSARDHQFALP